MSDKQSNLLAHGTALPLRDCNFCAEDAAQLIPNVGAYFVTCTECESCTGQYQSEEEAVEAWNLRMGELKSLGLMWQLQQKVIQDNFSGEMAIRILRLLKDHMFGAEGDGTAPAESENVTHLYIVEPTEDQKE